MGFYSFWSVTGSLVTKAVGFGAKVLKPILNGITNIANVVRDTAGVLSMVPVIGAVASQVGAAANIISSMEPLAPLFVPETTPEMPLGNPGATMPSNIPQLSPTFFNVLPRSSNPVMSPLIAPIIPKNEYPERRILKVRRPSARERSQPYQKDEVDDLTERMGSLNIGGNVPKTIKTGGLFRDADLGGGKRSLDSTAWMRVN